MADFFQNGMITTLHRLNKNGRVHMEREVEELARTSPIGLVLPALFSEFEGPAMPNIVNRLQRVRYLRRIVLSLDGASREQYSFARKSFSCFKTPVTVLWEDGERIQNLFRLLQSNGLYAGPQGKGRGCWLAFGYLLAEGDCDVLASHDCDILNYDTDLLIRLCYPVVNRNLGFWFCKGYYARISDQMNGRVTRLFVTPLVRAIQDMTPEIPFLRFLDSFRYVLAGEFAMDAYLARTIRIPADWGLEMGVLAEVYRNCSLARICQVDVADRYDHKHQQLSENDATQGLQRMTYDVSKSLFRTLAAEGVTFSTDHFRSLMIRYVRSAEDAISRYYADSVLNGLSFDRHSEELAVEVFASSLNAAARDFIEKTDGLPLIPNWNRVLSAIPNFFSLLKEAVALDEAEARPIAVRLSA
ncbi:MAG TPA: glycosyl transferase [Terriglobia bacterium]|nr:glycosyl transferase [Terriglobia bacterium]